MNKHFTSFLVDEIEETTWYTHKNKNFTALMFVLILHANRKRGAWMGIDIKRGEWVFSQIRLSHDIGMTQSTLSYSLKQLEKMGLIKLETHEGKNGYTKVSILKYDDYVLTEKAEKSEEEQEYPQYQRGMELEEGQVYQF